MISKYSSIGLMFVGVIAPTTGLIVAYTIDREIFTLKIIRVIKIFRIDKSLRYVRAAKVI